MPIIRSLARTAMLSGILLLTKGCTALLPDRPPAAPEAVNTCRVLLERTDQALSADGTANAASFRIEGFPYLRTDRFLAALEPRLVTREQTQAWLEAMHTLDRQARRKEIANLSASRLEALTADGPNGPDRKALGRRVTDCTRTLFTYHRYETDLRARLRGRIEVPDEYRTWRRLVGLYPLAALPVAIVTASVYDEFREWHATAPEDLPVVGRLETMRPEAAPGNENFDPHVLIRPERLNALGLPELSTEDQRRLAAHFAPVITQDTVADFDRVGTPVWKDGRLGVDIGQPAVYYYITFALLGRHPVLQINYVFWYPRRDGGNAPWIERGPLDGITVRISLDHRARPFMVDLMNTCGCYHFFIPERAAVRSVRAITLEIDPLVPGWLPPDLPARRLHLRVNTGWHQVQHVGTVAASPGGKTYRLEPYDRLEILPDADGGVRSMFDADGIAHDSERIEPLIFFSMGIPDIGSMRQRGHHAIRLVGQAYFDDPLLFEKSFEFDRDYLGIADADDDTRDHHPPFAQRLEESNP